MLSFAAFVCCSVSGFVTKPSGAVVLARFWWSVSRAVIETGQSVSFAPSKPKPHSYSIPCFDVLIIIIVVIIIIIISIIVIIIVIDIIIIVIVIVIISIVKSFRPSVPTTSRSGFAISMPSERNDWWRPDERGSYMGGL